MLQIPITVTFMFHSSFFNYLAMSRYLSFFLLSFNFTMWSVGTAKYTILQVPFFLFIIITSGYLVEIRWSVCVLKSHWSLCVSFYRADSGSCLYHLFVWSNFSSLHNSQWITLPTHSSLISTMLWFVWSRFFHWFPFLSRIFPNIWGLF